MGVELRGNAVPPLLVLAAEGLDLQAELLREGAAHEAAHGVGLMPTSGLCRPVLATRPVGR